MPGAWWTCSGCASQQHPSHVFCVSCGTRSLGSSTGISNSFSALGMPVTHSFNVARPGSRGFKGQYGPVYGGGKPSGYTGALHPGAVTSIGRWRGGWTKKGRGKSDQSLGKGKGGGNLGGKGPNPPKDPSHRVQGGHLTASGKGWLPSSQSLLQSPLCSSSLSDLHNPTPLCSQSVVRPSAAQVSASLRTNTAAPATKAVAPLPPGQISGPYFKAHPRAGPYNSATQPVPPASAPAPTAPANVDLTQGDGAGDRSRLEHSNRVAMVREQMASLEAVLAAISGRADPFSEQLCL